MSTTTHTPLVEHAAGSGRRADTKPVSFLGLARSEWIKIRSLRSMRWTSVAVVAISLGLSVGYTFVLLGANGGGNTAATTGQLIQGATAGIVLTQLLIAATGVLVVTTEYATGAIWSTLTVAPARVKLLAAKVAVVFAATFVVTVLSTAGGYLASAAVFAVRGRTVDMLELATLGPVLASGLTLGLVGVIAVGVGAVLRSSSASIVAVIVLLFVLPILLQSIPSDWSRELLEYLPSQAGQDLTAPASNSNALDWWMNLLLLAGWSATACAAGGLLLSRRDV